MTSAQGNVGQTVSVDVVLDSVPNGISGFAIDVTVQIATVARIQNVTLPEYGFQLVTGVPGSTVRIIVADAKELLQGQIITEVIATIELNLLAAGTSQIDLALSQLDGDVGGEDLVPYTAIAPGSVTTN